MSRGQPRHYVTRRGRAFWQPTPKMKAAGFNAVPLGPDGPIAFQIAEQWNRRWDAARTGLAPSPAMCANLNQSDSESLTVYPPRSLGEAFRTYRSTEEWRRKEPRTREDWWRGWKRIKPIFGDIDPRTVRLADLSAWRFAIEEFVSLREAHRSLKIWRALWKVAAAQGYCSRDADPSLAVRNSSPAGRSEMWTEGEAVRLYKRARRLGFQGLAAVIAVAWDSQMSPVDVRTLRASQFAKDRHGQAFFTERGKTGKPVGGILSARGLAALGAYLAHLPVDLHGDAFIFRNRSSAPYSKDTLGDDFRDVRAAEFGDSERRTLADFRRSGAVEAIAGGASAEQLSHAMGNTLSTSNALFAIYVPVNLATIRAVQEARRKGRQKR